MSAHTGDQVAAGFQAMADGEWRRARDVFTAAIQVAEVPEVLMGLGSTCYWLGDLDTMIASFERAFVVARRGGDGKVAAFAALSLVGYYKQFIGNPVAARGWLARAERVIASGGLDLRGELLGARAYLSDDPVHSEQLARECLEIARATGRADLELLALTAVGTALVQQGRISEGMALLDEAMAGALGGEGGDPLTVAHASCLTMLVCSSNYDIERATG